LLGVAALAGGSARATTGTNGLYGDVTRGPITPVCVAERPCSEPVVGATLVFSRSGREVGRTRTHADGSYRLALPPGTYAVRAVARRPLDPATAWVRLGHFRRVDFSIDTGIR
jgi:hypothetical protein